MTTVCSFGSQLQRLAPLRTRLAAVFGVTPETVLPVRGFAHAADIVSRYGLQADVIDERGVERSGQPSRVLMAAGGEGVLVYREIGSAYGVDEPLCGALIGAPALIEQLSEAVGGDYLHPLLCAEALKALAPARLVLAEARLAAVRAERARLAAQIKAAPCVTRVVEGDGQLLIETTDASAALARAAVFEADVAEGDGGALIAGVADVAANARVLAAFGVPAARLPRIGEAIRETKETKIAVRVDLDRAGDDRIATGVGYFDHMLEQIAAHGGVSLTLVCEGDTHVDVHHTIEDCALALGAALAQALGERRGIARYGFTLPMDEAEARVSIDLGGRPFAVFEGAFAAPLIGQYPTEMTAHVFRSLAQTLGAAIHVSVKGENDHHKTEACFKAFARALRAAIAVEGDAVPSTKGVL